MKCSRVRLPNGVAAIVCSSGKRSQLRACRCGSVATLLCDWKVGVLHTCDAPICTRCAFEVETEKHLCAKHQDAYRHWLREQAIAY